MRSSTNFLPAVNNRSPRTGGGHNVYNNHQQQQSMLSPTNQSNHGMEQDSNMSIKLENRVFYMEKAVARLINAFESIGSRMHKIEEQNNQNQSNIGALSRTIKDINDSKKDFISKQHIITERLVSDINKCAHSLQQQSSFINKEISDVRDSIQILSSNLQKNFNDGIKAAMQQCNDLNVQNSNSITSLRKITDQKISHLQQLIVDTQKRAQSQNSSILDIINSNQKNQSEFQSSFKAFFEKFRDSMHQNLSALQESSQEQISYLDNVLRAEVKTRMKNTENQNKETDTKIFQVQEIINQNKRDNKRSWEYISKTLESVKEQQKHAQTANQPLHKIITNLSAQFDEMSNQQLVDIKSIMQLNQDTSEKQFGQIKGLQIQIQQIWSKLSNQQHQNTNIRSPTFQTLGSPKLESDRYQIRPQSYKSDMSSTAAFNAIKHHLATLPGKPEHLGRTEFDEYIQDANPTVIETASELRETTRDTSPMPRVSITKEVDTRTKRSSMNENAINLGPKPVNVEHEESEKAENDGVDESEDYEDEYNESEDEVDAQSSDKIKEAKTEQPEPENEEELDVDDLLGEDDIEQSESKKEEIGNSEEMISMHDKFEASEQSKKSVQEKTTDDEAEKNVDNESEETEQEIDLDDLDDDAVDNEDYKGDFNEDDVNNDDDDDDNLQKIEKVEDEQEKEEPPLSTDDALKLFEEEQQKNIKNEDEDATSDNYSGA